jgi:hypothetical protein
MQSLVLLGSYCFTSYTESTSRSRLYLDEDNLSRFLTSTINKGIFEDEIDLPLITSPITLYQNQARVDQIAFCNRLTDHSEKSRIFTPSHGGILMMRCNLRSRIQLKL